MSRGSRFQRSWWGMVVLGAAAILLGYSALSSVRDGGLCRRDYLALVEQRNLFADIVPPPLFIFESRILARDLLSPSRLSERESLIRQLHQREVDYRTKLGSWASRLPEGPVRKLLLERSSEPADEYFRLLNEQFVPLVQDERFAEAEALLQGPMRAAYQRHESAIGELALVSDTLFQDTEKRVLRSFTMVPLSPWNLLLTSGLLAIGIVLVAIAPAPMNATTNGFEDTEALKQYQAALDAAAIVAFTDASGRITHANDQFCAISGYSREELIGSTHRIVNSGYHPREFWIEMWRTISRGQVWHAEVCNRNKDGRLYWVDTTIVPMRDRDGRIHQHVAIRSDITLRKEMEVSQRMQERKIRAVFDRSFQFIGLLDPQGLVVDVNRTALEFAGVTVRDVIGKPFWETPWWAHSVELQEQLKGAIHRVAAGESVRFEACHPRRDGMMATVDFSMKPVFDETGTVVWLVPEGHDITELRKRKEELRVAKEAAEAANRSKSEFLANMSHEIRTPMTAILGFADMLINDPEFEADYEQRIDAAKTIHRNGEHLLGIINDILDLSKIESGKLTLESLPVSPRVVIDEVLNLMRVRSTAKGIDLNVVYETEIPDSIVTDPLRLRQILVNLVGNAIKFTEVGGVQLLVHYWDEAFPRLEIDVLDTGIGIAPAELERLFKPFSQGDASLTRRFGGTGLGLTISRRLAEMLQGELSVIESVPGRGTRFRLSLRFEPFLTDEGVESLSSTKIESSSQFESSDRPLLGMRLLFAEDGPDNQRLIGFVLRKAGAEVTIAENGRLAVDAAKKAATKGQPYHVILMDMQMPIMDGYEATELLRAEGYWGPIVALTAHAMAGDREKCLSVGCNEYAAKPIDRNRLVALLLPYYQPPEGHQEPAEESRVPYSLSERKPSLSDTATVWK